MMSFALASANKHASGWVVFIKQAGKCLTHHCGRNTTTSHCFSAVVNIGYDQSSQSKLEQLAVPTIDCHGR